MKDMGSQEEHSHSGRSVIPPTVREGSGQESSGSDPIVRMVAIAKDPDLSDEDKARLIGYAAQRFQNRRRMAYVALWAIVGSLIFVGVAGLIDGFCGKDILEKIKNAQTLLGWIEASLAGIIAAYYGVSAWKPSS